MFLSAVTNVEDIDPFCWFVDSEKDSIGAVTLAVEKLTDVFVKFFRFRSTVTTVGILSE